MLREHRGLDICLRKKLVSFTVDVSWSVGPELAILFGYSGSGKSLSMRMIAGLIRPDSGRITMNGEALFDSGRGTWIPPQTRRLGFVGQDLALFPHLTVAKNISYGLGDLGKQERHERVEEFMSRFHLEGLAGRLPREISGGQQQRVALARTLARRPGALLLDEPFSALDLLPQLGTLAAYTRSQREPAHTYSRGNPRSCRCPHRRRPPDRLPLRTCIERRPSNGRARRSGLSGTRYSSRGRRFVSRSIGVDIGIRTRRRPRRLGASPPANPPANPSMQ